MNTVEKIIKLMNDHNVTAASITKELGLNHSAIDNWKSGKAKPSADALSKLADYFDVSVDYLLGRTDDPSPYPNQNLNIPQDIANVQFAFFEGDKDELTQEDIDDIAKYVRYMREKRRKENESKK